MPKISVVIPLYNKKEYIKNCLDSIFNNTFNDVEVIVVNDGSTDGSQEIVVDYLNKYSNIIMFNNENKGLSYSRNFGISKINTDYFLLLDADDCLDLNLLKKLNDIISAENIDVISFNMQKVSVNMEKIEEIKKPIISKTKGAYAIKKFILSTLTFDPACGYLYNTKFFKENNFKYAIGKYHEDFGLTPWIILNANSFISLDYVGYYYIQTDDSIMRTSDYIKEKKKAYDVLFHYDDLYYKISKSSIDKDIKNLLNIYISHTLFNKIEKLNINDRKKFIKEIRKRRLYIRLPKNSIKKIIKNVLIFINPILYLKLQKRVR